MANVPFEKISHRPWEMPAGPWRWRQSWRDLLFAHWPIPARHLTKLVPPQVSIQDFEGSSWVGIVPFRMEGVMVRPLPDLPGISSFPEINVRLYVDVGGKPGVWFVSLDAANPLAVWAARRLFHLPYFRAAMSVATDGEKINYQSVRLRTADRIAFKATYEPKGNVVEPKPGTIEHFLAERYCLYTQAPDGAILRANIHHLPWPLQRADAKIEENTIAERQGIDLHGPPALLHFSRRLDVVVWPIERVVQPGT